MIELELSKVKVDEHSSNHATMTVTPLPQGYGVTLGNALRRVLLSSLEGAAITSVKIEGATHEFSTLTGVKDSVLDIILNLKQVRFLSHSDEPIVLKLETKKAGVVTAKDFEKNSNVECVTPDVYISTLAPKSAFSVEVTIEKGVGYSPVIQRPKKKTKETNSIEVDTFFSPVRKVRYDITDTRVGQNTSLDQLEIEIETDGSISPCDALSKAAGILRNYFSLLDPKCLTAEKTAATILEAQYAKSKEVEETKQRRKYTPVEILKLSPRTLNALVNNEISSVEQLVTYTESKLSNLKGFGQKAMMEVKESLAANNLSLGQQPQ